METEPHVVKGGNLIYGLQRQKIQVTNIWHVFISYCSDSGTVNHEQTVFMRMAMSLFYVLEQFIAHHIAVSMEHLHLIYSCNATPTEAGRKMFLHADGSWIALHVASETFV